MTICDLFQVITCDFIESVLDVMIFLILTQIYLIIFKNNDQWTALHKHSAAGENVGKLIFC